VNYTIDNVFLLYPLTALLVIEWKGDVVST